MSGHFDIIAPLYDRLIPFTRVDKMVKTVGLPAKGRLLDVGGGTGRVAAALSPFIDSTIVADPSTAMLEQVLVKHLAGVKSEAENLPFASQTFERIIIVDVLHHVFNQQSVIAELWRVLKPCGLLTLWVTGC
jgi:demethylmenaquinone methyltransferase/2-methoxy-6-polyprenyl-1,4-benzoquinol methylase